MAFGEACSPCRLSFHFIIAKEANRALGQPTTCLGTGLATAAGQRGLAGWCSNVLRPQRRGQSCCFVSFLHSYSWKRELKRAQACLPSCIMTNSGQSISWSPPWDVAHSTCPCSILHSHGDSVEAAHQATVPAAEELCHLSTPCPKMLNLI